LAIDLYGETGSKELICSVFHDEREVPKKWLYHGFLFVAVEDESRLLDLILKERDESQWDKELHFIGLNRTRTMNALAERLTYLFCNHLHGFVYFYLLGIDYTQLTKDLWADRKTRDHRIYNRFFQIGLYSAIKWLFLHKDSDLEKLIIENIYSDEKERSINDLFHSMPITDIVFKSLIKDEPIEFTNQRIVEVNSDHKQELRYKSQSHIIQLVDLLVGAFSQTMDATSEHEGKCNVADIMTRHELPAILMKYDDDYFSSPFYKKYCISFFPKVRMSEKEIISEKVFRQKSQFYNLREIGHLHVGQPSLFDSIQ